MAKWFGPRGDCGCCDVQCFCPGIEDVLSPPFTGTPTIKIVISGLPGSYEWSDFFGQIFTQQKNDWELSGLNSANGTYFFEIGKTGDCIASAEGVEQLSSAEYTEAFVRSFRNVPDVCDEVSSTSGSTLKPISVSVSSSGSYHTAVVDVALSNYYQVRGQVEMQCPEYDYTTSEETNSITAGFTTARTWARSSGDIKILRRAIQFDDCGFTPEGSGGVVFETIGTITIEMVYL